jgi:hypothetical protein
MKEIKDSKRKSMNKAPYISIGTEECFIFENFKPKEHLNNEIYIFTDVGFSETKGLVEALGSMPKQKERLLTEAKTKMDSPNSDNVYFVMKVTFDESHASHIGDVVMMDIFDSYEIDIRDKVIDKKIQTPRVLGRVVATERIDDSVRLLVKIENPAKDTK